MSGRSALAAIALATLAACAGPQWGGEPAEARRFPTDNAWKTLEPTAAARPPGVEPTLIEEGVDGGAPRITLTNQGDDLFRNTYYDFPRDAGGDRAATIYDAACAPIAQVSQAFHDQVCVQGSGRLLTGETVSFAKRDCPCAAVCPRTAQKICFERLDPGRFPHGRGAANRPIRPLRTVAVDTAVVPLGTALFVPELVGLPLPEGGAHDGCVVAEDRGLKVVGRHLDLFTGDPEVTRRYNALLPSNTGVHARLGDPRCQGR